MFKVKRGEKLYLPKSGLYGKVRFECEHGFIIDLEDKTDITIGYDSHIKYEKFIEPKIKIGYKFYDSFGDIWEIVKASLNKKKKEYSYMGFRLSDGREGAVSESRLLKSLPYVKKKIKEMTVDEISKKLGYKVIIKK